jgi:hypothetical protein
MGRRTSEVNDTNWTSRQWLSWFLDNHSTTDLIPMGVWKAKRFIVADYGDNDEAVAAMRAAYVLDGKDGAMGILGAMLVNDLPPGTVVPELPEGWDSRQRYYYETHRDPELRPRDFGVKTRDR